MGAVILSFSVIALIAIFLTLLVGRVAKRYEKVKYLPGLLLMVLALYFYYLSRFVKSGMGFEDLGKFVLAMFCFVGGISGLLTALILEFREKRR